jgi:hypothetical protein
MKIRGRWRRLDARRASVNIHAMNVDIMLRTLNRHKVAYLLIGGVNFMMRHEPILTYDVDIWIKDSDENIQRTEKALAALKAEWGRSTDTWGPVKKRSSGWLKSQTVFCLTSPHGAIDIFRSVTGLRDWESSFKNAPREETATGIPYRGVSDQDMLRCQKSLSKNDQKIERLSVLKKALRQPGRQSRARH